MDKQSIKYLLAIIIVSVALRIGMAIYLGNQVVNLPGTADQVSYHTLALRVFEGYGFTFGEGWWPATAAGAPTAHWSYIYTLYLTIVYTLFGPNPMVARLIQAVIVGILQPLLTYMLGKRLFNNIVGLVAAGINAIYIYFVYYSGALMTEAFYITAILTSLYLTIIVVNRFDDKNSISRFSNDNLLIAMLGISVGITVLLRQLFLLYIPFLLLWIAWAGYQKSKKIPVRSLLIPILILVILVIPFTIFNYIRFNQFVLLNTNAGFALFWANHPIHGNRFIPILPSETYQLLLPPELLALDEASLDRELLKQGFMFIFEEPVRYLQLSLSRIPAYFMFWPSADSGLVSNFSRIFSIGVFFPFMLYGLIYSYIYRPSKLANFLTSPISLIYSFVIIYTAIHILSWALVRYRLPVDAVLILFAGLAIVDISLRIAKKRNPNTPLQSYQEGFGYQS